MKKLNLIIFSLLCTSTFTLAQNARFITQGTIKYEKKVNMFALYKEQIKKYPSETYYQRIFEEYQKTNPQFKTLKSNLTFSKDHTFYKPEEETTGRNNMFGNFVQTQQNNIIYTNTKEGFSTAQKKVYEETFLLKDSTRKINWKITDEFRDIAGYNCRRANALIMDSIYVVAFYTDQIPVSGGPESFTGLPGMILGVALPYENTTWFATSVLDQPVTEESIKAPTKGKVVNSTQLFATLETALKDWGTWANDIFKLTLL